MPTRKHIVMGLLAAALVCAGCGPEAGRPRGGGPGGDGGNKPATVMPQSKVFTGESP